MSAPDTQTILVTIPDCTVTHVLGTASILLTSGTLSLINYSSILTAPALDPGDVQQSTKNISGADHFVSAESLTPVLTLQIGQLAFPLMKDTLFGTDARSPRVYLFVPELGPAGSASQWGHIRLELPEHAQEPDSEGEGSRQDEFEQALIGVGLLKEGWEAMKDDIQGGLRDTVHGLKDRVSSGHTHPEATEAHE